MIVCDPCHLANIGVKGRIHPGGPRGYWDTGPFSFYCDCACHDDGPPKDNREIMGNSGLVML